MMKLFLKLIKIVEIYNLSDNSALENKNKTRETVELFEYEKAVYEISIEEGIENHRMGNKEDAWNCFKFHASKENPLAKYWMGYYLWEGYSCDKDKSKASKLFKEAADSGYPEAQLRYAFSIIESGNRDKSKINDEALNEFFEYLRISAENDNISAQFNLGEAYLNGKIVEKNEIIGISLLKVAALNGHQKAIDKLKGLNVKPY